MRTKRFGYAILAVVLGTFGSALSSIGGGRPHLNIDELVSQSDVVVVADVGAAQRVEATSVLFSGRILPGQRYRMEATSLYTLAGVSPDQLTLEFALPDASTSYQPVRRGTRMIFLKQSGEVYTPTNPYYPDLPALRTKPAETEGLDGADAVIAELAAVVGSPDASVELKRETLIYAYAIAKDNSSFTNGLLRGFGNTLDEDTRRWMQTVLFSRGDISTLPEACDALLSGTLSPDEKKGLIYGVGTRLTNLRSTPELARLLQSPDEEVRRAGALALWHTVTADSKQALIQALNDEDFEVREYAMRGLADLTGQPQWGPGPAAYENDPEKYRQHWLEWAKQNSAVAPQR